MRGVLHLLLASSVKAIDYWKVVFLGCLTGSNDQVSICLYSGVTNSCITLITAQIKELLLCFNHHYSLSD